MSNNVRVRFAPSPTGFLHVGNARTALYNWLFARATGGTFILRIDDTDQKRSTKAATEAAIASLQWLGLTWDEGPEIGGPHAPYFQAQRLEIYNEYITKLLDEGKAYHCFCSSESLQKQSAKQKEEGRVAAYDGRCRSVSREEAEERIAKGESARIRFKCPERKVTFDDAVRGEITKDNVEIGDFVICKDDGFPTYNFATVVDEALMRITHVIRGEDHISNTPKQILLFEALGYEPPKYAHTSTILGSDREKLSKRHGSTTLMEFDEKGYLPSALRNFLALLGWSHPDAADTLQTDDIVKVFNLSRFSKSPAVFDMAKLNHINAWHIRNDDLNEVTRAFLPHLIKAGFVKEDYSEEEFAYAVKLVTVARDYCTTLTEIGEHVKVFFDDEFTLDDTLREEVSRDESKTLLRFIADEIRALDHDVSDDEAKAIIKKAQKELKVKGKHLYHPIRIGVTGKSSGSDLTQIFALLGNDRILTRLVRFTEGG